MGNHVVAGGGVEGGRVLSDVHPVVEIEWVGRSGDLVPSERGGYSIPWLDLDGNVAFGGVVDT